MEQASQSVQDHDLLIEINTKLGRVIADVKELKDTTAARVTHLEEEKVDKVEADRLEKENAAAHNDHEKRLRSLEKWKWMIAGGLGLIDIILIAIQAYKMLTGK